MELFVPSPAGLEEAVATEVRALGAKVSHVGEDGVAASGGIPELLRLSFGLRIGSRVLVRLAAGDANEAKRVAASAPFGTVLAQGATFSVEVSGAGKSPGELSHVVATAAANAVRGARRQEGAAQVIHARVHRGQLVISADSTGEHLHRRGYRAETGAAPLRETLACGILALAGFTGDGPLVDPMCGSGTFPIEAALLALRRQPGRDRPFAWEHWPSVPAAQAKAERERARAGERAAVPAPILGSDLNAGALGVARRNAVRAGVMEQLKLARLDVRLAEPPAGTAPGVIVANLPYGKRVGETEDLGKLYGAIGKRLREKFAGWSCALLLEEERRVPTLALPKPRTVALVNGGLPVTLVLSHL